ncbi:MAG: DUF6159 family protein [Nanoarchaeota archaeon]
MNAFSRSWQLAKSCLHVLKMDKELVWFPIISGIMMVAVTLTFFFPLLFAGAFDGGSTHPILFLFAFLYYVVSYGIMIYFNAALVACADIRINGGDPTVVDGFRAANMRLANILGWALVAATVGVVLRILARRDTSFGRIVSGLVGMAWSLMTFFVVPVLVLEGKGPIFAIKRSASLFKKTWGENAVFTFSLGLAQVVMFLLGGAAILLGLLFPGPLLVVIIALVILYWVALAILFSALSGVFTAALYNYAKTGMVARQFKQEMIVGAVKHR